MPQVVSAGISTNATPPANGGDTTSRFSAQPLEKPVARANFVSAEYFPLLHIPVAQGRLWSRDEIKRGAALAVINQTMARQYWPNGDAIGRQFRFANMKDEPPYSPMAAGGDGWLQIIGVVADARNDGLRNPIKPAFYVPYTLKMRMFTQILVRTRVPPLSILRDVRAELVRVDREQQVMRVRDLHGWITNLPRYAQQQLVARLFGIFSLLALALSAVGLYSVVSYGVATRTNEFGIRMALGARARDVVRMVLSGTSWNVGAGLLAGVLLCCGVRQARLAVGDRELARSADPRRRDRPAAGGCRDRVSRAGAARGVDRPGHRSGGFIEQSAGPAEGSPPSRIRAV